MLFVIFFVWVFLFSITVIIIIWTTWKNHKQKSIFSSISSIKHILQECITNWRKRLYLNLLIRKTILFHLFSNLLLYFYNVHTTNHPASQATNNRVIIINTQSSVLCIFFSSSQSSNKNVLEFFNSFFFKWKSSWNMNIKILYYTLIK